MRKIAKAAIKPFERIIANPGLVGGATGAAREKANPQGN